MSAEKNKAIHGIERPEGPVTSQFRDSIANGMAQAARKAGATIDTGKMVITTRDDIFLANAPVTKAPGKGSVFEYPMFVYQGVENTACARIIPSGFYTIKLVIHPKTKVPMAHYINASGKVVLKNPVTLETRPVLSPVKQVDRDPLKVGVTLRSVPEQVGRAGVIILGACRCAPGPKPGDTWRIVHSVII